MDELSTFLATPPTPSNNQCRTCSCEKAAAAVREFARLKAAGEAHHTWAHFRVAFLERVLGFKISDTSLRRHLKECL